MAILPDRGCAMTKLPSPYHHIKPAIKKLGDGTIEIHIPFIGVLHFWMHIGFDDVAGLKRDWLADCEMLKRYDARMGTDKGILSANTED
jgi:hypothetical protein